MSLNKNIHPRNPYKLKPPDFKELAAKYPDFRSHCTLESNGKVSVNFQEDDAVRALTKAILLNDFNLDVDLPKGCLVPRVTQRLNYLLWIEDVLRINKLEKDVVGMDIGTGASCIYALLGGQHLGWRFVATDSDSSAVQTATENVHRNGMEKQIAVVKVAESSVILDATNQYPDTSFSFSMCNPPFYEKEETQQRFTVDSSSGSLHNQCAVDSDAWRQGQRRAPPKSATLARRNELQVEGGEVSFVSRMIDDSILLRTRISFYTTMLGKKSSLVELRRKLERTVGVRFTVSTLSQGRTQRWVLAWTFNNDVHFHIDDSSLVFLSIQSRPYLSPTISSPLQWMANQMDILSIQVLSMQKHTMTCEARSSTWTNQKARRRAEAELAEPSGKRRRLHLIDVSVQCSMGEGDGRDSYTNAGNAETIDYITNDKLRSVAIQTYHPTSAPRQYLIRFSIWFDYDNDRFVFEFLDGSKHYLYQIMQYFKNRFK